MAFDNIELEVKLKVDLKTFQSTKKKVSEIAKIKDIQNHYDIYYSKDEIKKGDLPLSWISIRKRENKNTLAIKKYNTETVVNREYCDEYEIELNKPDVLELAFEELGVLKIAQVKKRREKYIFNNILEISFDEVSDLGFFIEIEALEKINSLKKTRDEILKFIKFVEIKDYTIVTKGYPLLVIEKTKKI